VGADLSFAHLILGASAVVQLVMAALLMASVMSWTLIVSKQRQLKQAKRGAIAFEDRFWSGGDAVSLYKEIQARDGDLCGMERIFQAGFSEYGRLHKQTKNGEMILDGAQRAMRIALSREQDSIETNMSFLATVGSTSPYVGLFGTVWGIMNSFRALGNVQQATISMVAPGIAEALIATAIGLFAAIPAVIAYNRFAHDTDRLLNRYENFLEEFTSLLHRQVHGRAQA
jgi:biopolymer transport protein TolQ